MSVGRRCAVKIVSKSGKVRFVNFSLIGKGSVPISESVCGYHRPSKTLLLLFFFYLEKGLIDKGFLFRLLEEGLDRKFWCVSDLHDFLKKEDESKWY